MNSREIRIKIKSLSIQKLFDLDSYFSENTVSYLTQIVTPRSADGITLGKYDKH